MGWKVFADMLPNPNTFYQRVKFDENTDLICIRSRFVFLNDPTFTGLKLGIYEGRGPDPIFNQSIVSSNTLTKAEIYSLPNAIKEVYFKFPNFQCRKGIYYSIMPIIDGYVPSESSHIAWKRAWPDPIYPNTGFNFSISYIRLNPFDFHCIGAKQ